MSYPSQDTPDPQDPHAGQQPNPGTGYPGSPTPGGYPDPTLPVMYPTAGMPGDQFSTNQAQPYAGYGATSAFAGPPTPKGQNGLAIAGFIVGIAAFLTGWVPVLGVVLGLVGLVLSIIAVRRPQGRGFSVAGIILSALGLVTSLVFTIVVFAVLPFAIEQVGG